MRHKRKSTTYFTEYEPENDRLVIRDDIDGEYVRLFPADGSQDMYAPTAGRSVFGHDDRTKVGGQEPRVQVVGTGDTGSGHLVSRFSSNNAGPTIYAGKSRSGTIGDVGDAVQNGDDLLRIRSFADDGDDMDTEAARVRIQVDGDVSPGSVPGRITFETSAGGSLSEAVQIDSSQFVDFVANADETTDGMNKNPEQDPEDGYVTVKLNGTTYEIPAYETA